MKEEVKKEKPVVAVVFSIIQLVFSALTLITKVIMIFTAIGIIWMAGFIANPDFNLPDTNLPASTNISSLPFNYNDTSDIRMNSPLLTEYLRISGIYSLIFNSVFLVLVGLLGLIASIGALIGRNWGRKMLIFVAVLAILLNILNVVAAGIIATNYPTTSATQGTINTTINLVLSAFWALVKSAYYIALIICFNTRKVKEYYINNRSS